MPEGLYAPSILEDWLQVMSLTPTLVLRNTSRGVKWFGKHMNHQPGIRITAKQTRCLGCRSRLNERIAWDYLSAGGAVRAEGPRP